jgi:hypothetical protein
MIENPLIQFVSRVPGLSELKDVCPRPVREDIPTWWKNMPANHAVNTVFPENPTAKSCPGFPDFLTKGYTIPMWADTTLKFVPETGEWQWRCGQQGSPYVINYFNPIQFLQYSPASHLGIEVNAVFQLESPWRIITPPGYSIYQFPMFYHFNKDFSVLPGIVDTDIYSIVHHETFYFGNGTEVFIKRGTPLVHIIPFKRIDWNVTVRDSTEKDERDFAKHLLDLKSTFKGRYQQHQREMRLQLEKNNE